jgi:O-antigen ligase
MLSRAIIPIMVIMLFQVAGYKLSKEFIYTSVLVYVAILIYNSSQSSFLYRTSLNVEITQTSRIVMGAIEDSRAIGVSLIITMLFFRNTNTKYGIIALMLFGMFVTQTRQALLALLVIAIPYALFFGSKQIHKSYKLLKYLPILIILLAMAQNLSPIQRVFLEVERINMLFYEKVSYIDNRADVRAFAIDSIIDKPIMGNGFGYTESQFTYPHNIILEILAEFGLIGLIVAAFILFRQWGIMRDKKSRVLIFYCLILAMFSGNITQNYLLYLFMFVDFNKLLQLNQEDIYATN